MMIVTHTAWARTRETVDDERIVLLNFTQKSITTCVDTNMCIGMFWLLIDVVNLEIIRLLVGRL